MANKSIFETVMDYRLKFEKDGKPVLNVPTVFALPALFAAPVLSIAGLVAAPLLGLGVHLENNDGNSVDVGNAVRKAADAVKESVDTAAKTIRKEVEKAQEGLFDDDPEGEKEETAEESPAAEEVSNEEILEDLKAHEEDGVPVIDVKPDHTAGA